MVVVGVVGGGPAGIAAALRAAAGGARVVLFEANALVGRKLMATGNGRCNLSNTAVRAAAYACDDPAFVASMLDRLPPAALLAWLADTGVPARATADGWYYPLSDSAAAVVEVLTAMLVAAGVQIRLQSRVAGLRRKRNGFLVSAADSSTFCDRLVVACGGVAQPALGSRGDLLETLAALGHGIVAPRPALAPIVADVRRFHKLQGVRLDARLTLLAGETVVGESVGNLMFTQTGFSGPAPMNLSHLIWAHPPGALRLRLDLLPQHLPELRRLIAARRSDAVPLRAVLAAVLPPKVPPVFLALAGVEPSAPLVTLGDTAVEQVIEALTATTVAVKGTGGFDVAQLSTGGVPVSEVDPSTMQSRRVPGLYLAGEVLDVVGPCGGYNLHFAFTSGAIAGDSAAEAGGRLQTARAGRD